MSDTIAVDKREERIRTMFGAIAPVYDLLNHLLSLNIDRYWRWRTVKLVPPEGTEPILDLCTGTGDLALAYDRAAGGKVPIVGADFCRPMLERARRKIRGREDRIRILEADAQQLPFPANQFQISAVAFGLRNVTDTDRGIAEMVRVTRPGGRVAILEFSKPKGWIGALYRFYFRQVLPKLGQLVSRSKEGAYDYLPRSVLEFPDGEALAERLRQHGLAQVSWHPMTFGVATLYIATKPQASRPIPGNVSLPLHLSLGLPDRIRPRTIVDHLLIRAARGESVERPPVWAMRQAGRWDPKFHALRQGMGFYEFSANVELSIECSLLPKRFGVDAIILFYDITTLPVAMGQPFTLRPNRGPVPDVPIRSMADVDRLAPEPTADSFRHILDLLAGVKKRLAGELPVLVFAGAPFTVATYSIGTGKDLDATRRFVRENPATWHALLERLEHATGHFLRTLIAAGADAYQLFDSWAGMLEPAEYGAWAQPHHTAIFRAATGCPRILFVKEGPYLAKMVQTGADVISLGVRNDLARARHDYPHLVFQGNVDEEILRTGTTDEVRAATRRCLEAGGGERHIVNLNHGVDRATPVANFQAFIETVQAYR